VTTTSPRRPAEPDYDVEQEVDFGHWIAAVLTRWWLPVAGFVLGAIIGYVISLGGSQVYRAQATIYLGQPYGGLNSTQPLVSLQTNTAAVRQIVTADSTLEGAAAAAKMRVGDLRGHVTTSAVTGSGTTKSTTTTAPLVTITVTAKTPRRARVAANRLANTAVLKLAPFTKAKIAKIKSQIASGDAQLAALDRLTRTGDPATAALVTIERGQIQQERDNAATLLAQAQQVESPRIVTAAGAHKVTARSRRNTMVVAAVIGFILGLIAALAWDPVAGRFARR
jgi:capsular polysaccharide biosynthesis protein